MTDKERLYYCQNCARSIWGNIKDCDINIQNNGKYVLPDKFCKNKVSMDCCQLLPVDTERK